MNVRIRTKRMRLPRGNRSHKTSWLSYLAYSARHPQLLSVLDGHLNFNICSHRNTIPRERSALLIMKASTFFLGLATGSAAAAITVLYSTPKSGSELRSTVKSASTDLIEMCSDVKVKVNKLKGSISKMSKEAKETIPGAVDGIKHSFEKWQESTEPNRSRLETELSAIQEALENLEQSIAAQQKQ